VHGDSCGRRNSSRRLRRSRRPGGRRDYAGILLLRDPARPKAAEKRQQAAAVHRKKISGLKGRATARDDGFGEERGGGQ
jgi:hypothetical protein